MSDPVPPASKRSAGLVEYALIIALVAVLIIGIVLVLIPAFTAILNSLHS